MENLPLPYYKQLEKMRIHEVYTRRGTHSRPDFVVTQLFRAAVLACGYFAPYVSTFFVIVVGGGGVIVDDDASTYQLPHIWCFVFLSSLLLQLTYNVYPQFSDLMELKIICHKR